MHKLNFVVGVRGVYMACSLHELRDFSSALLNFLKRTRKLKGVAKETTGWPYLDFCLGDRHRISLSYNDALVLARELGLVFGDDIVEDLSNVVIDFEKVIRAFRETVVKELNNVAQELEAAHVETDDEPRVTL